MKEERSYSKDQIWTTISNMDVYHTSIIYRHQFWSKDCLIIDVIDSKKHYNVSIRNRKEGSEDELHRSLKNFFYLHTHSKVYFKDQVDLDVLCFQVLVKAKDMGWSIEKIVLPDWN
jgi:hypothetical protein